MQEKQNKKGNTRNTVEVQRRKRWKSVMLKEKPEREETER